MAGDSDINDQMKQQANAARIRAIRQLQRQVAKESGGERAISPKQARALLRDKLMEDFQKAQPQVAKGEQMEAQVRGWVQQEMQKFRISGQGVTGSGFSWVIAFPKNEQDDKNDDESDTLTRGGVEGGVFVSAVGAGISVGIVSAIQTDNVQLKSIDTTATKSIAVGQADGTLFFEWFYSNTEEGDGYINLLTGIHPENGATFRAIKEDHGKGIIFDVDADHIVAEAKLTNVGAGSGVFKELNDTDGIRLRSIKAGTGITVTQNENDIEIEADGDGNIAVNLAGTGEALLVEDGELGYVDGYDGFRTIAPRTGTGYGGVVVTRSDTGLSVLLSALVTNIGETTGEIFKELNEAQGIRLRGIKSNNGAIEVSKTDTNVELAWRGRSVGSATTIFAGVGDLDSNGDNRAEFKTIQAGEGIAFDTSDPTVVVISRDAAEVEGTDFWLWVLGSATESGEPTLQKVKVKIHGAPGSAAPWAIDTLEDVCVPSVGTQDWNVVRRHPPAP